MIHYDDNYSAENLSAVVGNTPLTIDELRMMHGQPVWIEEENAWGLVLINNNGPWKDMPFVVFFYENVRCEYDVEKRGLNCYRYKPERTGKWIVQTNNSNGKFSNCSECGMMVKTEHAETLLYCSHCGANMRV